jgi:UDP-galactopyranose mutase
MKECFFHAPKKFTIRVPKMARYHYLVVGSGLFGAVFTYKARQAGKKVIIIEKRPHTGGNVYCENISGIPVHKYGAHIFHTSNKAVWDFVNALVPFNNFINTPIANYRGKLYNLPFNMNTFYALWGVTTPKEAEKIILRQREESGITNPQNLEEQAIFLVGEDIYNTLIKGYTEKQWGRKCTDLPPFIIKRLPVRFTFDNNYFNDTYQGIPAGGYNQLIQGLLGNAEVVTDTDFFSNSAYWKSIANKIIYTGKIDEYFDYKLGKLEYRTVKFDTKVLDCDNYQGNAVVNYTDKEIPYTRIIEHKHFDFGKQSRTVISYEFSDEWHEGSEPFYPVNDNKNNSLYNNYYELSQKEKNVIFGGRLAEYKYYDMDKVIERALTVFNGKNA